jgi:hypothetical protein
MVEMMQGWRAEVAELQLRVRESNATTKMERDVCDVMQKDLDTLRAQHQQHAFDAQAGPLVWL